MALTACAAMAHAGGEDMRIVSDRLAVDLSALTGGFVSITDMASGHAFIRLPTDKALMWRLTLRDPSGEKVNGCLPTNR